MKDGEIVEQGTHGILMQKDGEYAKLYNVQAAAFLPGNTTTLDGSKA